MEKHFDKMDTQKTGFINIGSLSDYIINEFKMECDDQQKEDFKVKFHIKNIFVFFIDFATRLVANIFCEMTTAGFHYETFIPVVNLTSVKSMLVTKYVDDSSCRFFIINVFFRINLGAKIA